MEDPLPANISGEKRVVHTVEHQINWGYVAAAVAVLALIATIAPAVSSRAGPDEEGSGEW